MRERECPGRRRPSASPEQDELVDLCYPGWSAAVLVVDALVLWALIRHGFEDQGCPI